MKNRYYLKVSFIVFISALILSAVTICTAEEITLTTYYPSPYGVYSEMRLYPKSSPTAPCQEGTIYYDSDAGEKGLKVCDGSGNPQPIGGGFWTQAGSNLYPTNLNWNVGIGTASPGAKLDVAGSVRVAGNVNATGSVTASEFRDVTNTAYYLDPANTGTSLVTAGNVGIGTPNPAQGLHIAGSNSGGTRLQLENGGKSWTVQTTGSGFSIGAGHFAINEVGGGARLTIMAGGNVGIGTNSPNSSKGSPGYLDVRDAYFRDIGKWASELGGGGPGSGNLTISAGPGIKLTPNGNVTTVSFETRNCPSGQFVSGINDVSALTCATPTGTGSGVSGSGISNYIPKWTGATALGNSVIYENNGKVGIGTNNPIYPLDLVLQGAGGLNALIVRDPGNSYLSGIGYSSSSQQAGIVAALPGKAWLLLNEAQWGNAFTLTEAPGAGGPYTGRLTVKPGGNVGIGTMSPASTLEVNGVISTTSKTNDCGAGWTCTLKTWDISAASILISGYLIRASDARLKKDITPLKNSLDVAKQLQGVSYRWKEGNADSGANIHYGFIAQDMEKVLPNLVHETEKGIKTIEAEGIVPVLTEALKEQQAEIESLKSRIEVLENK